VKDGITGMPEKKEKGKRWDTLCPFFPKRPKDETYF
jgi:hypothetical protein